MILTEDEAKCKWCPESRVDLGTDHSAPNRDLSNAYRKETLCIASRCMAWRWEGQDGPLRDTSKERKGFCGIAGYPLETMV